MRACFWKRRWKVLFHESDGDIQVTCGAEGHDWSQGKVVALSEALEWLPHARELPNVEPGFSAEWTDGFWVIERIIESDDDRQDF
jgi:hypothetical protein